MDRRLQGRLECFESLQKGICHGEHQDDPRTNRHPDRGRRRSRSEPGDSRRDVPRNARRLRSDRHPARMAGLIEMIREKDYDNSDNFQKLTEEVVTRAGRTGGTFLHSSRTNPAKVSKENVPAHLKDKFTEAKNDLTGEVLKNLEWLGIDYLIPIGGDDTLSYGVRLYQEGVKVVGIPKTMDNDVPGTDYCIGFSTCVTRTLELANSLRTSAGSHERFLVLEVFGRYAGFTAMLPTMGGAAHRCVIPEHKFEMDQLTELMV